MFEEFRRKFGCGAVPLTYTIQRRRVVTAPISIVILSEELCRNRKGRVSFIGYQTILKTVCTFGTQMHWCIRTPLTITRCHAQDPSGAHRHSFSSQKNATPLSTDAAYSSNGLTSLVQRGSHSVIGMVWEVEGEEKYDDSRIEIEEN